MKKRLILVLLLSMLLLLGATACGKKDDTEKSNKEAGAEVKEIDLSDVTLRFGSTGWKSQEALLKAAGYDDTTYKVEYSTFQGGNLCLEAMAADQIDLTGSSEIPPVFASLAENGGNFKIIAVSNANTQNQELIIPKDSKIKSVKDLKGKKVGYIKSTTAQYFLYKMLEEAGLGWDDIEAVAITTADGVTALIGGELDAFASYGNSINAAKANGATTLATAEDILSGNFPYEASVTALKDDKKRAAIVDYLARIEKANKWAKKHVKEWAEISADPSGLTYEENLEILKKGYKQRDTQVIVISDEVIKSEQSIADVFHSIGLLEQKVDVSSLYDDSLSDELTKAFDE